jgi:hypothetical protein
MEWKEWNGMEWNGLKWNGMEWNGMKRNGTRRACELQVFCYDGVAAHEEMRQACFEYLKLGGIYSSGPISLLSGLAPKPSLLVMHFFMVALYGVGRLLTPRPTFK